MEPNKMPRSIPSDEDHEQMRKELEQLVQDASAISSSKERASRKFREAADYCDKKWKDCKIAYAAGNTTSIIGGLLTIGGGIATVCTAGIATPLLVGGTVLGFAGAGTCVGAAIIESALNSVQIQEAEEALKELNHTIQKVKEQIKSLIQKKNEVHVLFQTATVITLLGQNHYVRMLLIDMLQSLGISKDLVSNVFQAATRGGEGALINTISKAAWDALVTAAQRIAGNVRTRVATKAGTQLAAKAAGNAGAKEAANAATKVGGKAGAKVAAKAAGNAGAKKVTKSAARTAARSSLNTATKEAAHASGNAGVRGATKVLGDAGTEVGAKVAADAGLKATAGTASKAGAEAAAKRAGCFFIGVGALFLVWDAVDLGFTIRDIVENKGADAAKALRKKADEIETLL